MAQLEENQEDGCSDNIPPEKYRIFLYTRPWPYNFVGPAPDERDKDAGREDENSLKKLSCVAHFNKESEPEGVSEVDR